MDRAFSSLRLPPRTAKPRTSGLTMVLDKYMSVEELRGFAQLAGAHVDVVKFGWGTSAVAPRSVIAAKCAVAREHDILCCPGGTLMELAYLQSCVSEALAEAKALGFSCIEISDGTVPMPEEDKLRMIEQAVKAGFRVFSEVGSKMAEEDHRLGVPQRLDQGRRELAAGAWKIIMEARESGTLGIFDKGGKTQFDMVQALLAGLALEDVIFEAPLRSQQTELILRLGNAVNLGNVAPAELVGLETLRLGLRGDTLRHFHLTLPAVTIELGANGALSAAKRGDVIVVVDAIRTSATIIAGLAHGLKSIKPVSSAEDCVGDLTAGERGGRKIEPLDLDNSPTAFVSGAYAGRELVLTTSNTTECILAAGSKPGATVLIGTLLNAAAVADASMAMARESKRGISIVLAGRNNVLAPEDLIAASEICFNFHGAPVRSDYQLVSSDNFVLDFLQSPSGANLAELGRSEDVIFCAQKDRYKIVPVLRDGKLVPLSA